MIPRRVGGQPPPLFEYNTYMLIPIWYYCEKEVKRIAEHFVEQNQLDVDSFELVRNFLTLETKVIEQDPEDVSTEDLIKLRVWREELERRWIALVGNN